YLDFTFSRNTSTFLEPDNPLNIREDVVRKWKRLYLQDLWIHGYNFPSEKQIINFVEQITKAVGFYRIINPLRPRATIRLDDDPKKEGVNMRAIYDDIVFLSEMEANFSSKYFQALPFQHNSTDDRLIVIGLRGRRESVIQDIMKAILSRKLPLIKWFCPNYKR